MWRADIVRTWTWQRVHLGDLQRSAGYDCLPHLLCRRMRTLGSVVRRDRPLANHAGLPWIDQYFDLGLCLGYQFQGHYRRWDYGRTFLGWWIRYHGHGCQHLPYRGTAVCSMGITLLLLWCPYRRHRGWSHPAIVELLDPTRARRRDPSSTPCRGQRKPRHYPPRPRSEKTAQIWQHHCFWSQ